jgi:hypothetical protein
MSAPVPAHACAWKKPQSGTLNSEGVGECVTAILVRNRRSWDAVIVGCLCGRAHRFVYSGPGCGDCPPVDKIVPCCGTERGPYVIDRLVILPPGMQLMVNRSIRAGFPFPWPRFAATGEWRPVGKASPCI